jgi:hypothetical protein
VAFQWGNSAVLEYKEVLNNCCYPISTVNLQQEKAPCAQLVPDCRDLVRLSEFTIYCSIFLVLVGMGWEFCY